MHICPNFKPYVVSPSCTWKVPLTKTIGFDENDNIWLNQTPSAISDWQWHASLLQSIYCFSTPMWSTIVNFYRLCLQLTSLVLFCLASITFPLKNMVCWQYNPTYSQLPEHSEVLKNLRNKCSPQKNTQLVQTNTFASHLCRKKFVVRTWSVLTLLAK